ncbi:DUF1837 domain-containing protein [Rhizobium sp. NLR9b]|uniref:HamA C-terminal domain-containing protein n=1 Tax=unclassified Rhizobium TaxID=2613769 RepID=UPI001C83EBDE|nr:MULTISPECIES: DUF1837 domain-containing protein [unclassified Rhizobium]MBX5230299.1 DUF1837 domain-containing protein [Rhizobium sp. NLR9b]MBX5290968.1 DUF1837 domain-containing protein [Rhizobium sp. NLR10b]
MSNPKFKQVIVAKPVVVRVGRKQWGRMFSPYDNKPKPLFTRLETGSGAGDQAYCVGFELEAWRCEAYADHMIEWIIDYALKSDEIKTLSHGNTYLKLRQAAARIYKSEAYEKRGEIGEISLHAICREFFGTIPFAPRVFYLSASNEVVKSFDMVHVRYEGASVELWLGEAKFFKKRDKAIASALESVTKHIDRGFLKNEKLILGPQVSTDIPHFEKIRDILSEEVSLDVLFQKAIFPILIASDSASTNSNKQLGEKYAADVAVELASLSQAIANSGLKSTIKILLIYIPLGSKDQLAKAFDIRLKGLSP